VKHAFAGQLGFHLKPPNIYEWSRCGNYLTLWKLSLHCHLGKSKVQSAESDGRVGKQIPNPVNEEGLLRVKTVMRQLPLEILYLWRKDGVISSLS